MSMKLCCVFILFRFTLYHPSPETKNLYRKIFRASQPNHPTANSTMREFSLGNCGTRWKVSLSERKGCRVSESCSHLTRHTSRRAKCVQFPSDWAPRVEMMKKFNLMFNSNSHPFFIFAFPVTVPKMVIRFSIYMITNISEWDFYGVWVLRETGWLELNGISPFLSFICDCDGEKKWKFVTMKNLSIRDNCNPINSFPELLQWAGHASDAIWVS